MLLFDRGFGQHVGRYVFQCAMATVSMALILLVLDFLGNAAVVASLGASCFIVFGAPRANLSRPRYLLGGYAVGLACGSLCYWLWQVPWVDQALGIPGHPHVVAGAAAVGLAIFVMVITDTEHPPAAGVALGLVMGEWAVQTVLIVAVGIGALALIRTFMRPIMINLVDVAQYRAGADAAPGRGDAPPAPTPADRQGDGP